MADQQHGARPTTANMTTEQRARVEAAAAARWLVGRTRHPDGAISVDVVDVVSLAQWLLTGQDPFISTRAEDVDTPLPFEPGGPVRAVRIVSDSHEHDEDQP